MPTLNGTEKLHIPKGIQFGDTLTIKGAGIPYLHGRGRGDEIVQIIIKTPTKLSKRQEELFHELAALEGIDKEKTGFKRFFK